MDRYKGKRCENMQACGIYKSYNFSGKTGTCDAHQADCLFGITKRWFWVFLLSFKKPREYIRDKYVKKGVVSRVPVSDVH